MIKHLLDPSFAKYGVIENLHKLPDTPLPCAEISDNEETPIYCCPFPTYWNRNNGMVVLLIDDNIFIGDLEEGVKYDIAANIYSNVAEISYRPFDVSVLGRPYIEVGDAISCYVYDYSSGEPVTYVMAFSILTRTLKGIQWLRDEYTASGEKYQPEIKLDKSGASGGSAVNEIKEDIKEINNSIEDLQGNKQNFIHLDILEPTWDAPEGNIILNSRAVVIDAQDHRSGYQYVMWRRTNNHWEKMQVAQYSQVDLQAGVSDLPTGEIYLVYE